MVTSCNPVYAYARFHQAKRPNDANVLLTYYGFRLIHSVTDTNDDLSITGNPTKLQCNKLSGNEYSCGFHSDRLMLTAASHEALCDLFVYSIYMMKDGK